MLHYQSARRPIAALVSFTMLLNGIQAHNCTLVEALSRYSTCDVSDALGKLGYGDGGFLPGLRQFSPEIFDEDVKIIGPAYTVKYSLQNDSAPEVPNHYIDSIPEGAVIFISSPAGITSAVYGGLMSARAKYSKAAGTVIDGRFRDLKEHRDLDYPLWAHDIGTSSPYSTVKVTAINVPVKLQSSNASSTVHPGDYIIADLNGVVILPKDQAEEALPWMEKQVSADMKIAAALLDGMTFVEARDKFR